MSMSRMMLISLVVMTVMGCDKKEDPETVEPDWCDPKACASGFISRQRDRRGGVLHEGLPMDWAEVPSDNTVRPEVLLVTVRQPRAQNGHLRLRVEYREKPGDYAVTDRHCTGTFISSNEILTAAHCLLCTDFARTYAVMGFHKNHGWTVDEDGFMRVPADRVLQLCHVKGCADLQGNNPPMDVALVHTCSSGEKEMPSFKPRYLPEREPELSGLAIYSHAGGLPLRRHNVRYSHRDSKAYFSNEAGGSGAAMVNQCGEIVGVVEGNVPTQGTVNCTSDRKSEFCVGQRLTRRPLLLEVFNSEAVCEGLVRYHSEWSNGCQECNGILGKEQPGK